MTRDDPGRTASLAEIADAFRGVIIDIFGVIHDGVTAFPDAIEALRRLRGRGMRICLLSNSPRRSNEVADRLASMKIGPDLYDGLITSGQMVYDAVSGKVPLTATPTGRCYLYLGPGDLSGLLGGLGLQAVTAAEEAAFLLATGLPDGADDEGLARSLADAHKHALPMICANPDLEVDIGCRRIVCAGTLAARYEALGGSVIRYGKPGLLAYRCALRVLGLAAADVLAIGDSLDTDILGANRAGIASALVISGIHRAGAAEEGGLDWEELRRLCRLHGAEPRFVLPSMAWT